MTKLKSVRTSDAAPLNNPHRSWVLRLAPNSEMGVPEPASTVTFDDTVRKLGAPVARWAVEAGRELTRHVFDAIPELGRGEGVFETTRGAAEAFLLLEAQLLAEGRLPETTLAPEAVFANHDLVRRRVPLELMVRVVQRGYAYSVRQLLAECAFLIDDPEERARQLTELVPALQDFYDDFLQRVSSDYLAEERRWTSGVMAAREDIVRSVIGGSAVDVRSAELTLGYDLRRTHIAMVLESGATGPSALEDLSDAAELLSNIPACQGRLSVPIGATTLWVWMSVRTDEFVTGPNPAANLPAGVTATRGMALAGVEGFRASHMQAQEAARLVRMRRKDRPRIADFADVELDVLVSRDPALAHDFVRRQLGELLEDTAQNRDLRETLLAYLDEERSINAVAKRTHIARNTVTYRVKRAESLRGRPLSEQRLELHVALRLSHLLIDP
ncbi:helix-turn-helix domain-containing protein [Rhodococcus sp. T2V]|uniref:PucR family transcriptional regulator n=1 Tax=Rhodococcus sp. T2V TaxID=3034164 RepID=UPI0023E1E74C|nr:helix-turn-helix domain-containing protein [Rhodococcus sp. T2V]MDF3312823.1 helix-turn-helix domain-containing protein [Rhodococcus sp. T2V]